MNKSQTIIRKQAVLAKSVIKRYSIRGGYIKKVAK